MDSYQVMLDNEANKASKIKDSPTFQRYDFNPVSYTKPKEKQENKYRKWLWAFFWIVFLSFFIVTIIITVTVKMSLDNPIAQQNNAVFGTWDSTGAAIVLVGFPFVILYTIDLYTR